MDSSAFGHLNFDRLWKTLLIIAVLGAVFIPLGTWKIVDIAMWIAQ